jgi:hypothetical protein
MLRPYDFKFKSGKILFVFPHLQRNFPRQYRIILQQR